VKDMGAMMKQAQAMQARLAQVQEQIKAMNLEGTAGGGLVRIGVTGHSNLTPAAEPVRYYYTKETTFVDPTGRTVELSANGSS